MNKWEYKIIGLEYSMVTQRGTFPNGWEEELNALGKEGWELINLFKDEDYNTGDITDPYMWLCILKRKLKKDL